MGKKFKPDCIIIFLLFIFQVITLSAFLSCNLSNDGPANVLKAATSAEFDAAIIRVKDKPGIYVIYITAGFGSGGLELDIPDAEITVKGNGNTIKWEDGGNPIFFDLKNGRLNFENINIQRAENNVSGRSFIGIDGGTAEIRNGAKIYGKGNSDYGVQIYGNGGGLLVSGGSIDNCYIGLEINGSNSCVNISGGSIRGIEAIYAEGNGHTINISGDAQITGEKSIGIYISGEGHTLNINGGSITGYGWPCIFFIADNSAIYMDEGKITGNKSGDGIYIDGINNTLAMYGGVISGNAGYGLVLKGSGTGFTKHENAIIYGGNAADNSNESGAIMVQWAGSPSTIKRTGDAGPAQIYSAKINEWNSGLDGEPAGDWD